MILLNIEGGGCSQRKKNGWQCAKTWLDATEGAWSMADQA